MAAEAIIARAFDTHTYTYNTSTRYTRTTRYIVTITIALKRQLNDYVGGEDAQHDHHHQSDNHTTHEDGETSPTAHDSSTSRHDGDLLYSTTRTCKLKPLDDTTVLEEYRLNVGDAAGEELQRVCT